MAYFLTIRKQNKDIPIDISKLDEFIKLSKYKNGGYSLEEIDLLTMSFSNEYFFRETLYNRGLLALEDITKDITIRSKRNDKLEKVRYGLAYYDAKDYFDFNSLKYILHSKLRDEVFIERFLLYYRNSYINGINISKMRYAVNTNNIELLYSVFEEFYYKEVFRIDSTGEVKLNYRSLHDLAIFTYNYDKIRNRREVGITDSEDKIERELTLKMLSSILSNKKKIKTKEIDGQISIF